MLYACAFSSGCVEAAESVKLAIQATAEALADIPTDLVINNAGFAEGVTLMGTTKAHVMHQFKINCVGSFLAT